MGVGHGDHVGEHRLGVVGGELGVEHGQQDVFFFVEVQDEDGCEPVELGSQLLGLVGGGWTGADGGHDVGEGVDAPDDLDVVGAHGVGGSGGAHGLLDARVEGGFFGVGVGDEVAA
jgi:hypothetical protein